MKEPKAIRCANLDTRLTIVRRLPGTRRKFARKTDLLVGYKRHHYNEDGECTRCFKKKGE